MAAADLFALQARARRAYEKGRVLLGLRRAAVVLPMAALSVFACDRPTASCVAAALLAAGVIACEWRGQSFGRGARIGLIAGLPPLLLPLIVQASGYMCNASFCTFYPTMCVVGGIAGGALLGTAAVHRGLSFPGLVTAGAVAALCGTLGCLIAGLAGFLGLVVGLGAGAAPVLVRRRA